MHRGPLSNRRRRRHGIGVVFALGLLAFAVASTVVLLQRAPRRSGTDLTADIGPVVALAPAQRICQFDELLPGDTDALRLEATSVAAGPLPALAVTIDGATGRLGTGMLPRGMASGAAVVPLARVVRGTQAATICISNPGPGEVSFGGSAPSQGPPIEGGGSPPGAHVRIEYMRPGRESWAQLLPTLVHRFSLGKSDLLRRWEAAAALILMLVAVVLGARTMLVEEGRTR